MFVCFFGCYVLVSSWSWFLIVPSVNLFYIWIFLPSSLNSTKHNRRDKTRIQQRKFCYTLQFCALANYINWKDAILKDYCHGFNKPIKSLIPKWVNDFTIEQYMDYALLLSGSPFMVGVEEDPTYKQFFSCASTSDGHRAHSTMDYGAKSSGYKPSTHCTS